MKYSLTFSKKLPKIPFLYHFLPELSNIRLQTALLRKKREISYVIGWGYRPTADKARHYAKKHNLPYLALEDGFLRSIGLGVTGYPPYSLILDDMGMYYDCSKPSRLELLILEQNFSDDDYVQAAKAIKLIVQYRLSKYNHAPDYANFLEKIHPKQQNILVIDQTYGDMSVQYGMANETTFNTMLQAAIQENPEAAIWIKTHPDVLSGKKKGYLNLLQHRQNNINIIAEEINPIVLLERMDKVYAVTSQMGFEALLTGKDVTLFGMPWYAGWGFTDDRHPFVPSLKQQNRRPERSLSDLFIAAYLKYSRYINPNTGEPGTIFEVIDYLHKAKQYQQRISGDLYCVGISLWKRAVMQPFFHFPRCKLHFVSSIKKLNHIDFPENAKLLVWGHGKTELLHFAQTKHLPILRMEDGFIRSVGLGSNLVAPLSLVVDDLGIYFNPQQPSRLEHIIQNQIFSDEELAFAEQLRQMLIDQKINKYNVGEHYFRVQAQNQKTILVPGQVEDDASIRLGAVDVRTNLDLLKAVRKNNPDAYIIYKPHPDVVSKNRIGHIPQKTALQYANTIIDQANILDCIEAVDEVHTITSLSGFEALLRGKQVHCYGLPFYAGWGLTTDRHTIARRTRKVTLVELILATLVYYPQYIHPQTQQLIDVTTAISVLKQQRESMPNNGLSRHWLAKQWEKAKHLYRSLAK